MIKGRWCVVACYIKSLFAFSFKGSFRSNIGSIFVHIFLPKSKPMIVGTPPSPLIKGAGGGGGGGGGTAPPPLKGGGGGGGGGEGRIFKKLSHLGSTKNFARKGG